MFSGLSINTKGYFFLKHGIADQATKIKPSCLHKVILIPTHYLHRNAHVDRPSQHGRVHSEGKANVSCLQRQTGHDTKYTYLHE